MIATRLSYGGLLAELGQAVLRVLRRPVSTPWREILAQMGLVGVGAAPVAVLIATAAGFILALVLAMQLRQVGQEETVPTLLWVIMTEQVVPVGVALVFTGRSVSAITAELGSMQVSEEVKALFTMGIDVGSYLLLPRFLGFLIMLPAVTLVGIYASLFGGALLCRLALGMPLADYAFYAADGSRFSSVGLALAKSALFAVAIACVALRGGMNVRHGSREISAATTGAVVTSVALVTLADAAVTAFELA